MSCPCDVKACGFPDTVQATEHAGPPNPMNSTCFPPHTAVSLLLNWTHMTRLSHNSPGKAPRKEAKPKRGRRKAPQPVVASPAATPPPEPAGAGRVTPAIEPNGREYLVTTPRGVVFVALSLREAEAIFELWRPRS